MSDKANGSDILYWKNGHWNASIKSKTAFDLLPWATDKQVQNAGVVQEVWTLNFSTKC